MTSHSVTSTGIICLSVVASIACKEESPAAGTAQAPEPAAPATAAPSTLEATATPRNDSSCPAGKWEYDYSDRYVESVVEQMPGLKLVKEEGHVICTIVGRESGSYECTAGKSGAEHVLESEAGGMKMTVAVTVSGSSSARFESAGPNRWKFTDADFVDLEVDAKATVAGKVIPVPAVELFQGMDKEGGIVEYRCEGDTLKWKPQMAGMTTDWAVMKRVQ